MQHLPLARRHARAARAAIALLGAAVGCVDATSPGQSPDVLPIGRDGTSPDTMPASSFDSVAPGRLRGTALAASIDSTSTWQPLGRVRIEAATRDARSGAMTVIAATESDAAGHFVFGALDVPAGLLYVRATPAAGTAYRASRWLAAYAFTSAWATTSAGSVKWTLGPYLMLPRADAAVRADAPALLVGHVLGDDGRTPVEGARVVVERLGERPAGSTGPRPSVGVAASGRTARDGFFVIELPGAGLYGTRITAPLGSGLADVALTRSDLPVTVDPDASGFSYARFQLGAR
ncbi:MAG: hypothetical protein JO180_02455 [Gemmatirosa sp.]|nr:hypothetical protein [Gemmatirosa sp.]